MYLIRLLKKELNKSFKPLIVISVVSAVSNALLLATINRATTNGDNRSDDLRLMFMTIGLIAIFIITKKYVLNRSIHLVEDLVYKLRCRIIDKIRKSELDTIENIGTSEIYAKITNDALEVSRAGEIISTSFQSAIMIACTVIYVGFLSLPSFIIMLIYFVLGYYMYRRISQAAYELMGQAHIKEMSFFDSLKSILYGFKEIKINQKRNKGVYREFVDITDETKTLLIRSKGKFVKAYLMSQSFFYILITVIIFLVPMYADLSKNEIIKISSAVLFIVGPTEALVNAIPAIMGCNVAAENIINLEEKLQDELSDQEFMDEEDEIIFENDVKPLEFEKEIVLNEIMFSYPKNGFTIGPISMTIPKGELTFISGGNGAGKSTFLKLFTGLYYPNSGTIKIDDTRVNESNYDRHRDLFSVIFTDFFLFEKLHGLEHVSQENIDKLLEKMGIATKTDVIDYKITNRDLSTGQKKRLALVVSLLEDKTVYVFDEVAADQDPNFKKYYYKELLHEMKRQNKTVVVVTHDDFYFDVCDNHYKLADGQMQILNNTTQTLEA